MYNVHEIIQKILPCKRLWNLYLNVCRRGCWSKTDFIQSKSRSQTSLSSTYTHVSPSSFLTKNTKWNIVADIRKKSVFGAILELSVFPRNCWTYFTWRPVKRLINSTSWLEEHWKAKWGGGKKVSWFLEIIK